MVSVAASFYREFVPPPGLEPFVACVWLSHDGAVRVLPDACADIVVSAGGLVVAGTATTVSLARATPGRPRAGVRFRIGAAGAALGLPAAELVDRTVPLAEIWGRAAARAIEDRVAAARTPAAALEALTRGVADRMPPPDRADVEVRRAALVVAHGGAAGDAGRAAGLSERQLRRRFERAVGYGPATLARVTRFQRFLALARAHGARAGTAPLARLAADAGYADQAHLSRECRRLAGLPPAALLAAGAQPAGETADQFKPGTAARGRLAA
jgi:AraC-like DNA-binding protein